MTITVYDKVFGESLKTPTYVNGVDCLKKFKTGEGFSETITEIRELAKDKDKNKEQITELKKSLPVAFFCGEFKDNPVKKNFLKHSGLLVLDFDNIDIAKLKEQFKKRTFTFACFEGPSGNGLSLKVLIRIPKVKDDAEYQLMFKFFQDRMPQLDASGKNINRACFYSHDPEIYINENATEFELPKGYFYTMSHPDKRLLSVCEKILKAPRGESHMAVLSASYTVGGIVAGGLIAESVAIRALEDAADARRPNEQRDSRMAIHSAFNEGKAKPLYDDESISSAVQKFSRPRKIVQGNSLLISRQKIEETSSQYNEGTITKARTLGIKWLDDYLIFRDNAFCMVVGGKGSGKTTTLLYLFTLDAFVHGKKTLMVLFENDAWEAEQEVVSFLTGCNAKWLYSNNRARYNKAADFFHEHFTVMQPPPDYTMFDIFDSAAQINSQSNYDRLFLDPIFKIAETDDYSKNKKIASHVQPFAQDTMALWVSMHPVGSSQRAGGQPTDLNAEFGAMYSNAADMTFTIARDYKNREEDIRNTVNMTIDKVRSKKISGGNETFKDYPIKFEYLWQKNGYRIWVPQIGSPDNYEIIDNVFSHLKTNQ